MLVFIHRCTVLPLDGWFARDGVGVLACIPLNRFHATSQYQWLQNDCEMEDNTYMQFSTPQAVANTSAEWVDEDIHDGGVFSVTGMLNNIRSCWYNVCVTLYYWNCNWYLSQTSCKWKNILFGEKTACQLHLWKDTLCWQQCYLTICAWTLSMIFTLWILCSPVEQVIVQLGFELCNMCFGKPVRNL